MFRPRRLNLARADWIRITHNGSTADSQHRLNNGALYRIKKLDRQGNIVSENGWLVAKDFGHLAYGYVVTSHAAQGRTVSRVLVAQRSISFPASLREKFHVYCSRGREAVTVYCDDKQSLQEAVTQSEERITATDSLRRRLEVLQEQRRMNSSSATRHITTEVNSQLSSVIPIAHLKI